MCDGRQRKHVGQSQCAELLLFERTQNDALITKLLKRDGIGPITAITMRAEIAQFKRFDTGKQLARYCGLTPRNASNGQRQADAGLVKAGNTVLNPKNTSPPLTRNGLS